MILTSSGYCQPISPQVIDHNGVRGLFITPQQAKVINLDYISLHECREQRDSLRPVIDSAIRLAAIYEHRLSNKDSIIGIRERSINLRDSTIGIQALSIEHKDRQLTKITKARNTWKVLGLSGWGAIIVAGLVILL